jgi:hypothetical protein
MNYSPEVMKNMGEWVSKQTTMLEKEIIEAKAKEMQHEIDREVLWGMLQGMGWTRVMLPNDTAMLNATVIKKWLSLNCKRSHEHYRSDFLFEDVRDANWFKLRWGVI